MYERARGRALRGWGWVGMPTLPTLAILVFGVVGGHGVARV